MRDKAGNLVLPRYNNAALGPMVTSPNGSSSTGVVEQFSQGRCADCADSILLDIEGGAAAPLTKTTQSWWRTDVITSPIKTAVFTHLGSAVSSGWSRARGALLASSITNYIRRVPALEKPFDLKEIHHPGDPNDI